MNTLLDNFLVGLALLVSVGYAVASLGPKTWRNRCLAALSRLAERAPAFVGLQGVARRLAVPKPGAAGACGGCDNCGTESAAAPHAASAEVKVPVANIGRREIETPSASTRH